MSWLLFLDESDVEKQSAEIGFFATQRIPASALHFKNQRTVFPSMTIENGNNHGRTIAYPSAYRSLDSRQVSPWPILPSVAVGS